MKYLKIFLLCFSLFYTQVFIGQTAYAQSPTPAATPSGTGQAPTSSRQADDSAFVQREENEVENPSLTSGHIFTAVQMIVIGVMAPTIIMACGSKASTWVYGAGALYYVAMELMNMGEFKEGSEEEMVIYENEEYDKQIEGLNAAAEETQEAADAAQKKADLSRNAAIVYAVAAIVAMMEQMAWLGMEPACEGAESSDTPAPTRNPHTSEIIPLRNMDGQNDLYLADTAFLPLHQQNQVLIPKIRFLSNSHNNYIDYRSFIEVNKNTLQVDQLEKSLLEKSLNFFVPSAQAADTGVISGLVGGVASAIIVVTVAKDAMAGLMESFKANGWVRAAWYGGFAAIGYLANTQIQKAADKLEERAEQYRNLADKLQRRANGGVQLGGGVQGINQGFASSSIKPVEEAKQPTNCFTGAPGQLKRDEQCLCKKANNCKQNEVPKIDLSGFGGSGIISEPLSMFGDSANQLFSGNLTGAQTAGAGIGASAAKLRDLRRKINDKFNAKQKKNGQPTVNFADAEKGFRKNFAKVVEKGLSSLTPAQANALAKMAPPKVQGVKKDGGKNAINKQNVAKAASPARKLKSTGKGLAFSLDDDEEGEIAEGGIDPDDLAANMGDANMFDADISDRSDEDIFKIISTRYLKSYDRIFDESSEAVPTTK